MKHPVSRSKAASRALLFTALLLRVSPLQADAVPQPIVTSLTITATQTSTITASVFVTTSTISNCRNLFIGPNCVVETTVISSPVISVVTDYIATTIVSTIGSTLISEAAAAATIATTPTTHLPAPVPATSSIDSAQVIPTPNTRPVTTDTPTEPSSGQTSSTGNGPSSSPTPINPSSTSSVEEDRKSHSGLPTGAKAGIAVAVIVVVAAIAVMAFLLGRRCRKSGPRDGRSGRWAFFLSFLTAKRRDDNGGSVADDDESATQVDIHSQQGQPSPTMVTEKTNGVHQHEMEDPEFARAFFTQGARS